MYLVRTPRQNLRSVKSTELFIILDIEMEIYFVSGEETFLNTLGNQTLPQNFLCACLKFDFFLSIVHIGSLDT